MENLDFSVSSAPSRVTEEFDAPESCTDPDACHTPLVLRFFHVLHRPHQHQGELAGLSEEIEEAEQSEEPGESEGPWQSEESGASEGPWASEEPGGSEALGEYRESETEERGEGEQSEELETREVGKAPERYRVYEIHKPQETQELGDAPLLLRSGTIIPSVNVRSQPPALQSSTSSDTVCCDVARKWKRVHDLSKPKRQWGTPDRKLYWGNQDPIHPISQNALKTQLTRRIELLAQPKRVSRQYLPNRPLYYYSCGKESVIWESPSPTLFHQPSKRLQKLSQPRKHPEEYVGNRSLSNSERDSLKIPEASPRILRLSVAKGTDPHYLPPKKIGTKVSFSALNAIASPRIVDLAHPRIKREGLCYERERCEMPIRPITTAAMRATASPRVTALAKSKSLPEDYLPVREVYWPVSYAATHSRLSSRIRELANPNLRSPVHAVYYDPEVFKVKPAALKAKCSARIQQLAKPVSH